MVSAACTLLAGQNPGLDLVVLILSTETKLGRRRQAVVRQTWARWPASNLCALDFIFLIGDDNLNSPRFKDGSLYVPSREEYRHIPHKLLLGLGWAIYERPSNFYMKADDDSFVCISGFLTYLHGLRHEGREVYAGSLEDTPDRLFIQRRDKAQR